MTTEAIGADQVWEGVGNLPRLTGAGVTVAVIDSGINSRIKANALKNRVIATYGGDNDFTSSSAVVVDGVVGEGYRLIASDGGVFSFGAQFYGSLGGGPLSSPIARLARSAGRHGYYMVNSDGGVFAFGDAAPFG